MRNHKIKYLLLLILTSISINSCFYDTKQFFIIDNTIDYKKDVVNSIYLSDSIHFNFTIKADYISYPNNTKYYFSFWVLAVVYYKSLNLNISILGIGIQSSDCGEILSIRNIKFVRVEWCRRLLNVISKLFSRSGISPFFK